MKKSWKTTACGVIAIVIAVLTCLQAMWDEDPNTVANWGAIVPLVVAAVGLFLARDNDKSSEDVGTK